MEIILPNNSGNTVSVWNTELSFENQSDNCKDYIYSIIHVYTPTTTEKDAGGRPTLKTYIENDLKISIVDEYKYEIGNRKSFEILRETITLENNS